MADLFIYFTHLGGLTDGQVVDNRYVCRAVIATEMDNNGNLEMLLDFVG